MLFSIVINVYNGERYLGDCLSSVARQSYADYELVIVDDGSSDGTGAVADAYAAAHPNVFVLHGPNQGLLLARRRGLAHCHGEYVVFLDADDELAPSALEKVAAAISTSSPDVVAFRYSRKENLSSKDDTGSLDPGLYAGARYNTVKERVCSARFNNLCTKAFRLACIDLDADYTGCGKMLMAEDLYQLLPIIDSSSSLVQLNDALYYYRPNEGASTSSYSETYVSDTEAAAGRLLAYGTEWGLRDEAALGVMKLYVNCAEQLACARSQGEIEDELVSMRASVEHVLPDVRERVGRLRADRRLILSAMMRASPSGLLLSERLLKLLRSLKLLRTFGGSK